METTQTVEQEPTFHTVWAALQETDRILKENAREAREWTREVKEQAREAKEQAEERGKKADREIAEIRSIQRETGRQMQETDRRIGYLSNRFGSVVEHMVVPNLLVQFKKLGFIFEVAHTNSKIADHEHGIFTEVDAFLENGDKVMIVEIKTKPALKDIDYHVERIGKLRRYADIKGDHRVYMGAVAGVVMSDELKKEILERGFYLVEPSGETFTITAPEGQPHIW